MSANLCHIQTDRQLPATKKHESKDISPVYEEENRLDISRICLLSHAFGSVSVQCAICLDSQADIV